MNQCIVKVMNISSYEELLQEFSTDYSTTKQDVDMTEDDSKEITPPNKKGLIRDNGSGR